MDSNDQKTIKLAFMLGYKQALFGKRPVPKPEDEDEEEDGEYDENDPRNWFYQELYNTFQRVPDNRLIGLLSFDPGGFSATRDAASLIGAAGIAGKTLSPGVSRLASSALRNSAKGSALASGLRFSPSIPAALVPLAISIPYEMHAHNIIKPKSQAYKFKKMTEGVNR